MVNLTAAAGKQPVQISGGMKKWVGIARTQAIRPTMLLIDKTFAALDTLTWDKLQKQLLKVRENHRQAVMMYT